MKKLFSKIIAASIRAILALFCVLPLYFLILSQPQNLFAYKINYGRFAVYSDEPISSELLNSFDAVEKRIGSIEIIDSTFSPTVFICGSRTLYSIFTTLTGKNSNSQGLTLSLFGYTFINKSHVDEINKYHNPRIKHCHLTGEIDQVISHEMMHNLIVRKIGWFETLETPAWKLEGYAEYGSTITEIKRDSNTSLFRRAQILFRDDLLGATPHSKFYYKSQLIIEYLSEVKNYSFDRIFDKFLTEDEVLRDFWRWYLLSQSNS